MRKSRALGPVEIVVTVVGLLAAGLFFASLRITTGTLDRNRRFAQLIEEVKVDVAVSHASLEKGLAASATVAFATDVYAPVDDAIGLCRGMRDGGVTRFGVVPAVPGPEANARLSALCDRLQGLRDASLSRRRAAEGIAAERARRYDGVLAEVTALADQSAALLGATIAADRRTLNRINGAIGVMMFFVFVGTAIVVLGNRRALERRNRELARLAAIVESSDDGVYGTTPDGVITSWNRGAQRLYGYVPEEAVGRSVSLLVPRHRAGEAGEILAALRKGESVESRDTERVRKDGTIVQVSLTVSPMRDRSDALLGTSVIARDISERKAAEAELHRLNTAMGAFIANASHELRSPLTSLSGYASLLATERRRMTPQQVDEAFDVLRRQGERARVLINNLLDLAQLDNRRLPVEIQPVTAAESAVRALEAAAPPPGVQVEIRVPRDLAVRADPARLDQILVNLLTNAYRYGGAAVRIEAGRNGHRALLAVADDGDGVPAELVPLLFDPFTRGENAGTRQGSGLGLTISRRLAEAMGGEIGYERGRPRGARFVVRLPLAG